MVTCAHCGKEAPNIKMCPCKLVGYCDATCQKAAWKEHKKVCATRKKKTEEKSVDAKKVDKNAELAKQIQAAMNRAGGKPAVSKSQTGPAAPKKPRPQDTFNTDKQGIDAKLLQTLQEHTGCSDAAGVFALRKSEGDMIDAILDLTAVSDEDEIEAVMTKAGCTRREAVESLKEQANMYDAIMMLTGKPLQ